MIIFEVYRKYQDVLFQFV